MKLTEQLGEVIGWRFWNIGLGKKGDPILMATTSTRSWAPRRINYAGCTDRHREQAPFQECTCGYYLFNTGVPLSIASNVMFDGLIAGRVWGAGKTVIHTNGCRVQQAYPLSLFGAVVHDKLVSLNAPLFLRHKGDTYCTTTPSPYSALELLWKLARLYKIRLEEVPTWLT